MMEIAEKDPKVILITGDLGFSYIEEYQKRFPSQYLNCGIMEQAMVGIAAGMARSGFKPYLYSGSVFLICRPYEQVRDDVAYNNTNVKLIGTGASGFLGFTHNWTGTENEEDLLKNLPIKRFYPKNEEELESALLSEGPAYIRI